MKDEIKNLHTAIRRYCIDNHSYWTGKYSELTSTGKDRSVFGYTTEALLTFPRYIVLNAILIEIERYLPEEFETFDAAKRFFILAVSDAQDIFTKPQNGKFEQKVMDDERKTLCEFINQLTESVVSSVVPLFYRRVLSTEENETIWRNLELNWKITNEYWYPLGNRGRTDIEAFQDSYFEKEIGAERLRAILRRRGIQKVWEMREDGTNYELELSAFDPYYNGAEGYWCDDNFDWIIYASHESSITIGGWLLPEVQSIWPNWKDRIWTTPFFE